MFKINLAAINSLTELERMGVKYTPASPNEVKFLCPKHEEKTPSCFLNTEKNLWNCKGCSSSGDIVSLICLFTQQTRDLVIAFLAKEYKIRYEKEISIELVEKLHRNIKKAGPLLQGLYDRGVTDEMISAARIGFSERKNRITIPIYNISRSVIDIREYLPGAKVNKFRSQKYYGGIHLYQSEQLGYNPIWIAGGEIKALVLGTYLKDLGAGAVSTTCGEGSWHPDFNSLLKDKIVYICMDVDQAGKAASIAIAKEVYSFVRSVFIVKLPLDIKKYPHGDINDYIFKEGKKDFIELMKYADQWHPPQVEIEDVEEAVEIPLSDAINSEQIGKRIKVEGVITSMDSTPFLVPKKMGIFCGRDQGCCSICPIKQRPCNESTGETEVEIPSNSKGIIEIVNINKRFQREGILIGLNIPTTCKVVKFIPKSFWTVLDVRLSPQLNIAQQKSHNISQPAYCVCNGEPLEMNTPYKLTGKILPRPQTQQAVMLMDKAERAKDSLDTFKCSREELALLSIFKADVLNDKLIDIYMDLEANVTKIYARRDLHLLIDLCYHAPLRFRLDEESINGWTNVLIVGDSSQGKTKTLESLMLHYGLGERVDCKNATTAGLLGGLHQMGGRWFASWGIIPTHDRRLVILEEIKGMKPEVCGSLTDMRSSGVAMIPKIEKQKAFARTRLIMASNPKSGKNVSSYSFGTEVIKELIPGLEDIRRFDIAMLLASEEVDIRNINKLSQERTIVEHKYTSKLCQLLILWAWTRKEEQVIFEQSAMEEIIRIAVDFTKEYTELIPIVDRGTIRQKLARLTAGLAARVFSTDDTGEKLIVKREHVLYIEIFIKRIYNSKYFRYDDYSKTIAYANTLLTPDEVKINILGRAHAKALIEGFLYCEQITLQDIMDWGDMEIDTAKVFISFLVRKHAIYRYDRHYLKTAGFIVLLREVDLGAIPCPRHEKGEEF